MVRCMISKNNEKKEAIILRKQGLSYNEIRDRIRVSKSTLSLWLRSVGMAKKKARLLTEKQRISRTKAVRVWHERRVEKTFSIKQNALNEISTVSRRELWLIGTALYWAEGTKERGRSQRLQFSNMDPHMLVLYKKWLVDILNVKIGEMEFLLSIHQSSQNIDQVLDYWANFLEIPINTIKITLKKHNLSPKRKYVGVYYRGVMRITVRRSTDLTRKIAGWVDGIILSMQRIGD